MTEEDIKKIQESADKVCDNFYKKYLDLLHGNMNYCRYEALSQEAKTIQSELDDMRAQMATAYKAGKVKKAFELEKAIVGKDSEAKMISDMMSEIDRRDVLSSEEKIAFANEFKTAMDTTVAGELMAEIKDSISVIRTNAVLMETVVQSVRYLHSRLRDLQQWPCSFDYPGESDFDYMIRQTENAAERIGFKY